MGAKPMKDDWKNLEVLVYQEGSHRVVDGKMVVDITNHYARPDHADLSQRLGKAMTMLKGAMNEFIAVDRDKGLTDKGVKLIVEFGLLGWTIEWEGKEKTPIRYETETCQIA